jgi:hypothetical protein
VDRIAALAERDFQGRRAHGAISGSRARSAAMILLASDEALWAPGVDDHVRAPRCRRARAR